MMDVFSVDSPVKGSDQPTNLYLVTDPEVVKKLPIISQFKLKSHTSSWLRPIAEYLGCKLYSCWIGGDTQLEPFVKEKYYYVLLLKDEVDWSLPDDFDQYLYRFYAETQRKTYQNFRNRRTERAAWQLSGYGHTTPHYYDYVRGIDVRFCTRSEADVIFEFSRDLEVFDEFGYCSIFWDKDAGLETNLNRIKQEYYGRHSVLGS